MAHRLAAEAESDLDDIWLYIAKEASPDIADRFIDSLTERFWLLARYPYVGRNREEQLRPGIRSFPVGVYVILYRWDGEDIVILRVLHGNRNIDALLST